MDFHCVICKCVQWSKHSKYPLVLRLHRIKWLNAHNHNKEMLLFDCICLIVSHSHKMSVQPPPSVPQSTATRDWYDAIKFRFAEIQTIRFKSISHSIRIDVSNYILDIANSLDKHPCVQCVCMAGKCMCVLCRVKIERHFILNHTLYVFEYNGNI